MPEKLLTVKEVAKLIGRTEKTIQNWYMWKHENPDNELAQLLPEYQQAGPRQTRYWHYSDIWKMQKFIRLMPIGRKGVMGSTTQKYIKKEK